MLVNHHIAAALASERERDLLADARRRRRTRDAGAEPERMAPLAPPAGTQAPWAEAEHDGRIAVRIARARRIEAGHRANARARERVSSR